ncbi:hypothetical protein F5Y14DRAFT_399714 [Nemania sp. NC0429]|nr:hypothetical protein F5Y14DRAFT_399714 [Nemania sp. NC0429]
MNGFLGPGGIIWYALLPCRADLTYDRFGCNPCLPLRNMYAWAVASQVPPQNYPQKPGRSTYTRISNYQDDIR